MNTSKINKKGTVAILGAGLVGPLLATLLSEVGFRVFLIDKRKEGEENDVGDRSLQLSLSKRAAFALSEVGLLDTLKREAIEMTARCVHFSKNKIDHFPYSQNSFEFLYTLSRSRLRRMLIGRAKQSPNVEFLFGYTCSEINLDAKQLTLDKEDDSESKTVQFDFVVGADGLNSKVREAIDEKRGICTVKLPNEVYYKSFEISPAVANEIGLEKETVHVWPRGNAMVVSLAVDDNFNAALVMPKKGSPSFESIQSLEEASQFFEEVFDFSSEHADFLAEQYVARQPSHLPSLHCASWFYEDTAVLVGDSGCTVVPWYAQGINWGFTQALTLRNLLVERSSRQEAFEAFQNIVRPASESILRLSKSNYFKLSSEFNSPDFLAKKEVELVLMQTFPDSFKTAYSLLAFSLLPYEEIEQLIKKQDEILLRTHTKDQWQERENLYEVIDALQELYAAFFEKQYQKNLYSHLHVLDIDKISFSLQAMQEYIQKEFRITHISLYGSCVYKKSYSGTDIDLWVEVTEDCTLLDLCRLKTFLESRFSADVEISRKECLRSELREYMMAESVNIF